MTAVIDIWNMALANIGQTQVTSIAENSRAANVCRVFYNNSRDFVLQDFDWSFAERRAALALIDYTPTGYEYAYSPPADWLRSRRIYQEAVGADPIQFIENATDALDGVMIFTDQLDPVLIYTAAITVPNVFSPAFTVALSWKLAADIAFTITKNLSVQTQALGIYERYIAGAQSSEVESNNEVLKVNNKFTTARL